MPFVAYVHAADRDPGPEGPRPWQPEWRVWRWLVAALFVGYGAVRADGAVEALLVLVLFGLVCKAVDAAVPGSGGLRDYRQ